MRNESDIKNSFRRNLETVKIKSECYMLSLLLYRDAFLIPLFSYLLPLAPEVLVTNMNLFYRLGRFWQYFILRRKRIPLHLWHEVINGIPVLRSLNSHELNRLRVLASLFLHRKTINGAAGLVAGDKIRVTIAVPGMFVGDESGY